MSLRQLGQPQSRREEACHLLAKVYGLFTEGIDATGLRQAKAWLEELTCKRRNPLA
jgi:predicted ATPase